MCDEWSLHPTRLEAPFDPFEASIDWTKINTNGTQM